MVREMFRACRPAADDGHRGRGGVRRRVWGVTPQRVNFRNGYRQREWDIRAGTVEAAIPKLREGTYFPSLLQHRRRAERALVRSWPPRICWGCLPGGWRSWPRLGVTGLRKSQVSVMAAELDEVVACPGPPLDAWPYTFVWLDALTQKVREGGRR